jgi:hypothetical protein
MKIVLFVREGCVGNGQRKISAFARMTEDLEVMAWAFGGMKCSKGTELLT